MAEQALRPGPMSFQDWRRKFSTVSPGAKEIISHQFDHRQTYTSGTTVELTYFQAAVAGINGNWPGPNGLNNGNSFLMQALGITIQLNPTEDAPVAGAGQVLPGAIRDMNSLIYGGFAELKIGEKDYGKWPVWKLPAGGGTWAELAEAGTAVAGSRMTAQHAVSGVPEIRNVYSLPIPLAIPPLFSVEVTLKWPVAITLAPAQNPNIDVWLDGQLMRPIQ